MNPTDHSLLSNAEVKKMSGTVPSHPGMPLSCAQGQLPLP